VIDVSVKNEFGITNPKAPFILLQKMLDKTNIETSKRGDMKWIYKNVDQLFLTKKDINAARKLLINVMFIKE
jgi:hypothetical protein